MITKAIEVARAYVERASKRKEYESLDREYLLKLHEEVLANVRNPAPTVAECATVQKDGEEE